MIEIKVEGLQGVQNMLNRLRTQDIPRASVLLVNDLATKVLESTKSLMMSKFDRPTDWTTRSFRLVKATQSNLTAKVEYNRRRNFMKTQVEGGSRGRKAGESLLIGKGLMSGGQMYVPGAGARLDAFGNMSRGQISQIMSFFRAYTGKNARNNRRDGDASLRSGAQFFAITRPGGGLGMGIYQRILSGSQAQKIGSTATTSKALRKAVKSTSKRGVLPVMYFKPKRQYRQRLPFYDNAHQVVARELQASINWTLRMVLK